MQYRDEYQRKTDDGVRTKEVSMSGRTRNAPHIDKPRREDFDPGPMGDEDYRILFDKYCRQISPIRR